MRMHFGLGATRRSPQGHYRNAVRINRDRITLQKKQQTSALRGQMISTVYAAKLDDYCLGLRLERLDVPKVASTRITLMQITNSLDLTFDLMP
jgi:hypothetical protein